MTLPYLPRLICLCLAAYFLVHLALGTMVALIAALIAAPASRVRRSIRPHLAARCLLILRLLPAWGAGFVVAAVCLPNYLWLEPDAPTEHVGFGCLAASLLGTAMWAVSLARGLRASGASRRFAELCRQAGHPARMPGGPRHSYVVDGTAPLLAIGGIVRPRLVISRAVLRSLTAAQMSAALRHERAHWRSHDNLKRLCIRMTPDVLPFAVRSSAPLERGWRKFAEWAADDRAVAGDARRSCALATALVRVARLTGDTPQVSWTVPLLGDADELAARVDRLLDPARHWKRGKRGKRAAGACPILAPGAILLMAAFLAAAILQPAALYSVHLALERLVE